MIAAFSRAFGVFRRHPRVLGILIGASFLNTVLETFLRSILGKNVHPALVFLYSIPNLIPEVWIMLATIIISAEWLSGRELELGAAFGRAWSRLLKAFLVALHYYAFLVVGIMLLVLPMFYLIGIYSFVFQIVALESLPHSMVFPRSRELARSSLFSLVLIGVVPLVMELVPATYTEAKGFDLTGAGITLAGSLLDAFVVIALTALYLDKKARKSVGAS